MTDAIIVKESLDEDQGAEKFRLIFHIGAGKTGTSSIQQTLRTQKDKLKQQGLWYFGLMLEHAPVQKYTWQRASGCPGFLTLDRQRGSDQLLDVLRQSIVQMRAEGCRQAIWSNECFFARSPAFVVKALQQLAAEGVDLRIIAYVRRHDAWARSAYVQWGLKHKTYGGPLQPFDKWLKGGLRLPQFLKRLQPWIDAFGSAVVIRNMDAVGDVVSDFINVSGIRLDGIDAVRANDSPPGEELVLRALFNERFKGKSRALEFDRLLDGKSLRYDLSVDAWLQELMPSDEALRGVAADSEQDRAGLNVLLLANGQPPIDVSPKPTHPFSGK